MVFDRISLIAIYDVLKIANENDGLVSNIIMNRTSLYGTKTAPKMNSIAELKSFIEENYPYVTWNPECECVTCNEGIYTLLGFTVNLKDQKHSIFVNNLRKSFESAKNSQLNDLTIKSCDTLFKSGSILEDLKSGYVCFPYINTLNTMSYMDPCEYVEIIKNDKYATLINSYYKLTKRRDFPKTIPYSQTQCGS